MIRFLSIALLISLYSCSNEINKEQNETENLKDSLKIKSDSFNVPDLNLNPSLQSDIPLDTIDIIRNKRHTGITIVIPKLSASDNPEVFIQLKDIVKNKKNEFYEMTKYDIVKYDSGLQSYSGCSMWMEPKSLYRTEKVVSFMIEIDQACGGPIGFKYRVINFDNKKKKQISLGDYFVLKSPSDTAFLEKIIGRAINRKFSINDYLSLNKNMNFSFDGSQVYFCFDRYDLYSWGVSSVKKEYIIEHINPTYR
jgi:hypothetical protein